MSDAAPAHRTLRTDAAADSPFRAEHARILAQLARGGDADRAPVPAPGALCQRYAPQVCEAARRTWRERMVNEHRSSAVFAALLPQLIEASSGVDAQTVVLRAATDEIHHAVLCGRVLAAFGGAPAATAEATLVRMPEHRDATGPLERAVRNVMFVGCLAETVAVALITEERELASEPFVRDVFEQILGDEIAHARLGWRYVTQGLAALDDAARARTSGYLRVAFAYLERRETALLPFVPRPPGELHAQREAVGLCDGEGPRALFHATVERVIVPGLEALGLDAGAAWRERDERASAHAA